jgi:hypothetical protein
VITTTSSSRDDEEKRRVEHSLMVCDRTCTTYLRDLYALYLGVNSKTEAPSRVRPVTTLDMTPNEEEEEGGEEKTDDDVREWTRCVKWCRHSEEWDGRCEDEKRRRSSLEWMVQHRTAGMQMYYSVGETGELLVSRENPSRTILLNRETVRIICGDSNLYCRKPTIVKRTC